MIYRVLNQTVDAMIHTEGHISSIEGVCFPSNKNDYFVTISTDGVAYVWDNNEMCVLTKCQPGNMQKTQGSCVTIADDESVVVGYTDGCIRAYTITDKSFSPLRWEMNNAHKGTVTAVFAVKKSLNKFETLSDYSFSPELKLRTKWRTRWYCSSMEQSKQIADHIDFNAHKRRCECLSRFH